MHLIKKYPNRKFYDTRDKRYLSLQDIASLVKGGQEIQVIESKSEQDITTVVLAQILREQEKRENSLPQPLLTALIRRSGDGLKQLRESFQASLQALQVLEAEVQDSVERLAERGEISLTEAQELREELLARARRQQHVLDKRITKEVEASLARLAIPTSDDLERVRNQLADIESKVESLLSDLHASSG